ncbi:uncharacterized protein LOC107606474 [Arachis ipaensis]|uniref:uncharacterized protein LOC107606474 n=1 Tax=Arachis ipaensis TaxID=130454 RepID=UPI0007AFAAA0|nr:uncharacterized protein LOC107606474 [Arachis ipaensis]
MVGCTYTHQVWKRLEDHFASQIKAKVMQLKYKLSTLQIGASVTKYVLSIKGTIDALVSVREVINESDHVNAILHGLTEDYSSVYTSVLARAQSITVAELEALLLAHESMLSRFRKPEAFVQANLAQFARESFRGGFRGRGGRMSRGGRSAFNGGRFTQDSSLQEQPNEGQFHRGQFNRGGRLQNPRGYMNERPQCQVCNKVGHTARTCWYRYSEDTYEGEYENGNGGYNNEGYSSGHNQAYSNRDYSHRNQNRLGYSSGNRSNQAS